MGGTERSEDEATALRSDEFRDRSIETLYGTVGYKTLRCPLCEMDVLTDRIVSVMLGGEGTRHCPQTDATYIEGEGLLVAHLCSCCANEVFSYTGAVGRSIERKYKISWINGSAKNANPQSRREDRS